ncbi:ParA family protein [Anabaena sphaerica FACHB-251]|uniref:ParA family protein n=1 Tax=Anabaena sphaerica FACHB-251 TaxID=2692883 RepID=A0A926WJQ4_9NOST|nr:ParA family protein [Anabaena sphaerica]MBD2295854.1 ParA family protein [Anabaena sphaerica FACHB-251]
MISTDILLNAWLDIRLYTWVDVEEVLLRIQEKSDLPNWLVSVQAYWDSLTIGIRPGTQDDAKSWLKNVYDNRFRIDEEDDRVDGLIILESLPNKPQILPVIFEETEEAHRIPRLTPSLARPGIIIPNRHVSDRELPPSFDPDFPPIVAFHSFKGGVGRTTNAIAFAQALIDGNYRVLLVDGDLEAPGISWLLEQRLPSPPVSFADLIALVHGDPDPKATDSIGLVADRLQNAFIDNIYFLPAFRSTKRFTSLEIKPEHLIQGAKNPFILTQILADLGKTLNVDVVLVDLRAGLSELSTGLILDPRVYRVFVTTLSGQSIAGTKQLLELVGERAPSVRETDPLPIIIISQVPEELKKSELLQDENKNLDNLLLDTSEFFLEKDIQSSEENNIDSSRYVFGEVIRHLNLTTGFSDSLLVLPTTWEKVNSRLHRSGIVDNLRPLLDVLPIKQTQTIKEDIRSISDHPPAIKSQRESLRDISKKLVYAETAEIKQFLPTIPLRHLASDHRHQIPITVVVGAKGSGKTYTFLQIIHRENWQKFAEDACATQVQVDAIISPILASNNLKPEDVKLVADVQKKAAQALGFENPQEIQIIRENIENFCQQDLLEGQWREHWLDVIAWGVGFQPEQKGAGRALTEHLFSQQQRLLVVIDGLEDLFQDFASDKTQQKALRALLQAVPEWLGQQPGRFLGILIFIRRDMVLSAILQNAAQMMARYEPYALKWNREEALRLVAWVTSLSPSISLISQNTSHKAIVEELQKMKEEELTQILVPLWGKKVGTDTSKEAASARFVIAALSDFRGQIQSRDLMRLLYLAAEASVDDNDDRWLNRILTPKGIKGALPECSTEKIAEIEKENTTLKDIFAKLRDLFEEERKIPFTRQQLRLSLEEMKILEENGVIIREKDDYYMPEIFRLGLDFKLTEAGRPAVMSLARRAAKQGS